ncbi:uncharacterized protein [Rutidosis leptorrhynchoides]|uniref:uncharacterized protein n=1 Tax=Rutidosis leptorrhynchoides TaxID=125765 RepID=UPI003A98EC93
MGSRLRGSNSDSEDLRIVQLIQEIEDDDSEVESAPSIPRVRGYIPREWEVAAQHLPTFTTIQKCTSVIRQLAYGTAPDMWDEYLQMSEQTSILCLDYFCMCIITLYKKEYMRSPNARDVARLYSAHEERHGFRGMLGSIDCMHWEWRNCPVALKGQYTRGDHKKLTLMLEAVASYDLWIWHAFFGMAGSNNDINVLNQSPIFDKLKNGTFPSAPFEVNGNEYSKGYYLADGIYPDWATLVKGYSCPT